MILHPHHNSVVLDRQVQVSSNRVDQNHDYPSHPAGKTIHMPAGTVFQRPASGTRWTTQCGIWTAESTTVQFLLTNGKASKRGAKSDLTVSDLTELAAFADRVGGLHRISEAVEVMMCMCFRQIRTARGDRLNTVAESTVHMLCGPQGQRC